jgi:DNA-binding CsgD family transcriptional regulator
LDLIVINGAGEVKAAFPDHATRMLPELEALVFEMMADFQFRDDGEPSRGLLESGFAVHLSLLLDSSGGAAEKMYAVRLVADRHRDCLARAIKLYHLTNRQTDVLLQVFDGASAGDVARALGISEYTAQGYIKTLLAKTGSRNRTAMVAKVLDWPTAKSCEPRDVRSA